MPKVSKKHFDNPFPDYSSENAKELIYKRQISKSSKISSCLTIKWQSTLDKFNYLDPNDYSVYTGTSGIALLKLLKAPQDIATLKEVKKLLRLNHLKQRRQSFLCGDAGPLAIGAVVTYRLGEMNESKQLIEELLHLQEPLLKHKPDVPNEYLYGRAGFLYALMYVNKHIRPPPVENSVIRKMIEAIFVAGQKEAKTGKFDCPLMYQWNDTHYLGAAHGVSGIMYLLLQAHSLLFERELHELIMPTIDFLSSLEYPGGNYPSSLGNDSDKYVQWCHGAPGFVYMYCQAYKVFSEKKYLDLALKCGDIVWKRGLLTKGYSLCHGVAGNAYCFLELYQTTRDAKHLYRAMKFAEWCVDYTKQHEGYSPDRPLSLYEGTSGPMYLLLDIQKPLEARFPGFTI